MSHICFTWNIRLCAYHGPYDMANMGDFLQSYAVYFTVSQKKIMALKIVLPLVSCQNSNFLRNFSKLIYALKVSTWNSKLIWADLNVFSDANHSLRSAIWYGWFSITDFERMHLTLNDSDFIIFISRRCRNYKGPETILDIQSNKQVLVPYTLTDSFPNRKFPYDWNIKVKWSQTVWLKRGQMRSIGVK